MASISAPPTSDPETPTTIPSNLRPQDAYALGLSLAKNPSPVSVNEIADILSCCGAPGSAASGSATNGGVHTEGSAANTSEFIRGFMEGKDEFIANNFVTGNLRRMGE